MKKPCQQRSCFGGEKTKSTGKKHNCEFIRINTSKRYDEDYEIGRIETFIRKFKDRQLKKLEKKIKRKDKRTRRQLKELKLQLTSQITQ